MGKSYQLTFKYTGGTQRVKLKPGTYFLECWGADGGGSQYSGNTNSGLGGKGGYSFGLYSVTTSQYLYIGVGGLGKSSTSGLAEGGYNGGGSGYSSSDYEPGNGGGGATHIATSGWGALLKDYTSYNNRDKYVLLVAGGGGGGGEDYLDHGGNGGGLAGSSGKNGNVEQSTNAGGTQTAAGPNASFGQGSLTGAGDGGGGGGGWYGGGGKTAVSSGSDCYGGGGGSGYVGGLTYGFTYAKGENGYIENPDTSGNGLARITYLGTNASTALDLTNLEGSVLFNTSFNGNILLNGAYVLEFWSPNGRHYAIQEIDTSYPHHYPGDKLIIDKTRVFFQSDLLAVMVFVTNNQSYGEFILDIFVDSDGDIPAANYNSGFVDKPVGQSGYGCFRISRRFY